MRSLLVLLLSLSACAGSPPPPSAATGAPDEPKKSRDEADLPEREPGPRTAAVSNRVVRHHRARFRACYDQARAGSAELAGKVELAFFILPDGTVRDAEVDAARSEIKDEGLSACLVKTIKAIKFPAAAEEVGSRMHYPFDFQPGGAR